MSSATGSASSSSIRSPPRESKGAPSPTMADAVSSPPPGPQGLRRFRKVPTGLIGIVALLLFWELVALIFFSSTRAVPTPTSVVSKISHDGWHFYWPNLRTTLSEATKGWFWGNALAILAAMLFLV